MTRIRTMALALATAGLATGLAPTSLAAQSESVDAPEQPVEAYTGPIIDMHLHAMPLSEWPVEPPVAVCAPFERYPAWDPARESWEAHFTGSYLKDPPCQDPLWSPETDGELMRRTLEVVERHNVYGVLSEYSLGDVERWRAAAPGRFIPGLAFDLGLEEPITPDSLRRLVASGKVRVLGEITNAYSGIAPDDPRMEPYWALAEELDVPVGIHLGPGAPGEPHAGYGFRGRLQSALTMEEVLVRHPRLRVYLMHAGYPFLDDLLSVLYNHPQVYVGVGDIVFSRPRPEFYRYLRGIVEAGFGNRVMFGSDNIVWPKAIERGIAVIREAPFLSEAQKRDILYDNAARFLRLSEAEIARHHGN